MKRRLRVLYAEEEKPERFRTDGNNFRDFSTANPPDIEASQKMPLTIYGQPNSFSATLALIGWESIFLYFWLLLAYFLALFASVYDQEGSLLLAIHLYGIFQSQLDIQL